jgi:hypothetical protein
MIENEAKNASANGDQDPRPALQPTRKEEKKARLWGATDRPIISQFTQGSRQRASNHAGVWRNIRHRCWDRMATDTG